MSASMLMWAGIAEAQPGKKKKSKEPDKQTLQAAEDIFTEAMKFELIDKPDKALEKLEQARQLTPENATINFKTAEILTRQNKLDLAIPYAKMAIEQEKTNVYFYLLLGQLYERQGRYLDAAAVYKQCIKNTENSRDYIYNEANAYLMANEYKKALKVLKKIEKDFGVSEELTRQKQQIYLRQNKLEKAIDEGEKLAKQFPDEPIYQLALATLLASNNKLEDAISILNKVVDKYPNRPEAYIRLFEIYRFKKEEAKAMEYATKAFNSPELNINDKIATMNPYLNPTAKPAEREAGLTLATILTGVHNSDAKAWAIKGDLLSLTDRREEARACYLRATKLPDATYAIWEQIVRIDIELNQIDSIVSHTAAAVENFPNQAVMWYYNGRSHLIQNNRDKAAKALEQAKRYIVNNKAMTLEVVSMLGDAYHGLKKHEKSDENFEEALKIDPDNDHVLNNYAYFLSVRKEKLDVARRLGERLMKVQPNEPTYQDTYGWILYVAGEYQEAKKWLEKAATKSNSGTIHEHLGDVLFKLGEPAKAIESWRKAKQLGGELSDQIDKKIAEKTLFE